MEIKVSCLCPGPTRTEFGEVAGFGGNGLFDRVAMTAPEVVGDWPQGAGQEQSGGRAGSPQQGGRRTAGRFARASVVRKIAGAIKY